MSFIDRALGISPTVLQLREQRFEMIAGNLANSDTPGYKAVDLDFKKALASAQGTGFSMSGSSRGHISSVGGDLAVKYRVPLQSSLDGNTVETDFEHSEFMQNAIRYQASLNFLDGRIQSLRNTLRGE